MRFWARPQRGEPPPLLAHQRGRHGPWGRAPGTTFEVRDGAWYALPEVLTIAGTVPGYETSVWYGISAPKGDAARDRRDPEQVDPKMRAKLVDLGGIPMPMSPAEFGKLIAEETEKWAKVVKFAKISVE
jgi:Tripartite tricarboxylate transporter family receptor